MKGVREAGNEAELADLRELEVRPCMDCNVCRYRKPCVQKRDFNELARKVEEADPVALASPLHYWLPSPSIPAFIERFYCIADQDPDPPLGRYERYHVHDSRLLLTSADDFFWTY